MKHHRFYPRRISCPSQGDSTLTAQELALLSVSD